MTLSVVRESMRDALGGINGLSVSIFQTPQVLPPHAVIRLSSGSYDRTMGRGLDELAATVIVYVSRAMDDTALEQLDQFITGTGPKSIKAAIESATGNGISFFRVSEFEVGVASVGDQEFLAATFDVQILLTGQF